MSNLWKELIQSEINQFYKIIFLSVLKPQLFLIFSKLINKKILKGKKRIFENNLNFNLLSILPRTSFGYN